MAPEGPRKRVSGRTCLRCWASAVNSGLHFQHGCEGLKKSDGRPVPLKACIPLTLSLGPSPSGDSGREKQKAEGFLEVGLSPTTASAMQFQIRVRQGGESALFLCDKALLSLICRAYLLVSLWRLKYLLESFPTALLGQERCSWLESLFCKNERRKVNPEGPPESWWDWGV